MANYYALQGNDSDVVRIAMEVTNLDPVWKEFPDINQAVARALTLIFNQEESFDEREKKLISVVKASNTFKNLSSRPEVVFRENPGPHTSSKKKTK